MKVFKGWKGILTCILITAMVLPGAALAAGKIDPERPVSLTISCQTDGGSGLAGEQFDIYRVADLNAYGEMTITEDFREYAENIKITGKNDEAWRTLASTLEGYVQQAAYQGSLKPVDSGRTDAQGNLTFPTSSGSALKQGLYLVVGHYFVQGGYSYDPAPFMILLPDLDMEKNQWVYDVSAKPKQESGIVISPPTYISKKVLKVWNDSGKEALRPAEVTVHLLRDGKVYDTVKLSAANSWKWSWDHLSAGYSWNVVEEVSGDYKVEITQEGITFVVKNTYDETNPDKPEIPVIPEDPDVPLGPGNPDGSVDVNEPDVPLGPKLPQTGMLWWPVPALAALGLLLLGAGILYRRREEEEENRA